MNTKTNSKSAVALLAAEKINPRAKKGLSDHDINARYYMQGAARSYDVIDRALELQFVPAIIFSNASEAECREWVLRNCEEPVEHTPGEWFKTRTSNGWAISAPGETIALTSGPADEITGANANLLVASPKLLALLEQYHQSFPGKESGKLICEAKGWTIEGK